MLGAALCLAAGCRPSAPPAMSGQPVKPTPPVTTPSTDAQTQGRDMSDVGPVRDAVSAAIKSHASLFPKGTRLIATTVHGGVAALDFSPEFNHLANMGESTESGAQKQLRAALAKFPEIDKMTVTVAGKPFDSQATDWTTPFPVRPSAAEREAAVDAATGDPAAVSNSHDRAGGH